MLRFPGVGRLGAFAVVFAAAAGIALPGVASAQSNTENSPPQDFVLVHLDSSMPVQLEYRPDEATPFERLCTSPCVRAVPASGTYRVGPVITDAWVPPSERPAIARQSNAFVLTAGRPRQTIAVDAAAQSTFGLGLGITITGGVAVAFGFFWTLIDIHEGHEGIDFLGPALSIAAGAVGIATGTLLLVNNLRSKVTVDGEPAQAPRRREAEERRVEPKWRLDERDALRVPMRGAMLPLLRVEF